MKQQNVNTQQIIQIMEIVTKGLDQHQTGLSVVDQESWSRRYADPAQKQFIEKLLSTVFNCDGKALLNQPEWQNIENRIFEHTMK